MMVSYMLFTNPCMKQNKFESLCDQFINIYKSAYGKEKEIDYFDELIRSAFNYNLMDVINRASLCFNDNWWFVTHFIDLIFNSNQYKDYQIADIEQIRDSFVADYADSLFTQPKQFWQLGIEYLIHCKDSQDHILLCLERVPFDSEQQLQTLILLTKRFNFVELELSLYKIQSRKWLKMANACQKQKLGSALFWAIRSKDKMLVNTIVDQYLRHYLKTANQDVIETEKMSSQGELLDMDLMLNLGSTIVLSERLIFLSKYHEFHQLQNASQYSQAAKIIVDMLSSNAIPEFFIFQVILDCLPLLEANEVVIDSQQTCKILASFEQISDKLKNESNISSFWLESHQPLPDNDEEMNQIKTHQRSILKKYENILRLAITRNLSRNFVLSTN